MNRYLEKIAEATSEKKSSKALSVAEGVAGITAATSAPKRLLGYHTLYHGTISENAKSIRKNGLDPNYGGGKTGSSNHLNNEAKRAHTLKGSEGKIHVTKRFSNAAIFAGFNSIKQRKMPGIVTARVSDKTWQNMKADPDMGDMKYGAATSKHRIDPKYIQGGKTGVNLGGMLNKRRLTTYYKSSAGKNRALRGLALGAAGVGMIAHALNSQSKSVG